MSNNQRILYKVMHVSLASYFTDSMMYQDNLFSQQNSADGHDVVVVAACERFAGGEITDCEEEDTVLSCGSRLVRLRYWRLLPKIVVRKLRLVQGFWKLLNEFKPDVILHHGIGGLSLFQVAVYSKKNPRVRLFVDTHADSHNSSRNLVSSLIQHRLINRALLKLCLPYIEKVFYITPETGDFARQYYRASEEILEYLPLGGVVVSEQERLRRRLKFRTIMGIKDSQLVFFHSGKLNAKKLTLALMRAFLRVASEDSVLLIAGVPAPDISQEFFDLLNTNEKVISLGWLDHDALLDCFCIADCYLQPGTQSNSLQSAICCGLPVVVRSYPSHVPLVQGNGVYVESEEDLQDTIHYLCKKPQRLVEMRTESRRIAETLLDNRLLSTRYLE